MQVSLGDLQSKLHTQHILTDRGSDLMKTHSSVYALGLGTDWMKECISPILEGQTMSLRLLFAPSHQCVQILLCPSHCGAGLGSEMNKSEREIERDREAVCEKPTAGREGSSVRNR